MKTKNTRENTVKISPKMWDEFSRSMLSKRANNEELMGFLLCDRQKTRANKNRYIVKGWIVPDADCYEYQSQAGLSLKQEFNHYLLQQYVAEQKLDVVHIHTHPGEQQPRFSAVDNFHESQYAKFLTATFSNKPQLISGVFNESLTHSCFRQWANDGKISEDVGFSNGWFDRVTENSDTYKLEPIFTRQEVFGKGVQQQLGELEIALIGCGGIGSIFTETLARLGVKKWTLIDPDVLETVNLNRMPGATKTMVERGWTKVHYAKKLIKKVYPTGSYVREIAESIESERAQKAIAKADLIVVATDNHLSRQIAQETALSSNIPLVCLGTHIDILENNVPRMYCRVTVPPLGGGWCLMCGNVISSQKAALESAPVQISDAMVQKGYLPDIGDPAVFWLNGICASKGVGVIHSMVSGFLKIDRGIDWIYDFANGNWLKADVDSLLKDNCYFCGS